MAQRKKVTFFTFGFFFLRTKRIEKVRERGDKQEAEPVDQIPPPRTALGRTAGEQEAAGGRELAQRMDAGRGQRRSESEVPLCQPHEVGPGQPETTEVNPERPETTAQLQRPDDNTH